MKANKETFEEVQKFCKENAIDIKIEKEQKIHINGFPYWEVTNWDEFTNAIGMCQVPTIGSVLYHNDGIRVEIRDDFVWNNKDYRFDFGDVKDILHSKKIKDRSYPKI